MLCRVGGGEDVATKPHQGRRTRIVTKQERSLTEPIQEVSDAGDGRSVC